MGELVLITGTSSGIGLSAAVECAAAGHRVIATMRNLDRREELERTVASRGVSLSIEQLDVTAAQVDEKVRELILKYGPFFGLVNNAGIACGGAFEEQSDRDIREQFETNVFGLMSVTRAVLPSMRTSGRGRIINISSISGRVGLPAVSGYAASKHAVEGFSESLRWELEPFGIDVLVVEPGTFRTPILARAPTQSSTRPSKSSSPKTPRRPPYPTPSAEALPSSSASHTPRFARLSDETPRPWSPSGGSCRTGFSPRVSAAT